MPLPFFAAGDFGVSKQDFRTGGVSSRTSSGRPVIRPHRERMLRALLLPLLVSAAAALAAKRVKVNKYAKFSKADSVRQNLRFSNIDDAPAKAAPAAAAAVRARNRSSWEYPDAALVDQRDPSTFGFTEIGVVLGAHGTRGELKVSSDSDFARERLCTPGVTWLRRPRRRAPREVRLTRGRKGPGTNSWLVTLDDVGSREGAHALKGARLFIRRELRPSLAADELMLWELEGLTVARAERASDDARPSETHASAAVSDDAVDDDAAVRWVAGETVGSIIGVIPREELTGSPTLGNDLIEVALQRQQRSAGEGEAPLAEQPDDADDAAADAVADADAAAADADTVLIPYVPQIVVEIRLAEGLALIDPPEGLLELIQPKRAERVVIRGLIPASAASLRSAEPDDSLSF